jgi:hypothetical protein
MDDNDPQALQIILDESLIAIQSGRETIDSILAKYPLLADELRPDLEAAQWLIAQRVSSSRPRIHLRIPGSSGRRDQAKQHSNSNS